MFKHFTHTGQKTFTVRLVLKRPDAHVSERLHVHMEGKRMALHFLRPLPLLRLLSSGVSFSTSWKAVQKSPHKIRNLRRLALGHTVRRGQATGGLGKPRVGRDS